LATLDGVKARVAEKVGDQDKVGTAAETGGAKVCRSMWAAGFSPGRWPRRWWKILAGAAMSRFRRISAEPDRQPRRRGRLRCLGQQLQGIGGIQILKCLQRGWEVLAQRVAQPLGVAGAFGRSTPCAPASPPSPPRPRRCPQPPDAAGGNRCAPSQPGCARQRRRLWSLRRYAVPGSGPPAMG
jgi:hypothetical protein